MNFPVSAKISKKGHLMIGGCDAMDLAAEFDTPLYVIDKDTVRDRCSQYKKAFASYPNSLVIFASKALSAVGIIKLINEEGLGVDVSTSGELYTALKAASDPKNIYFHGNNKSEEEITYGLKAKVGRFVADNIEELHLISNSAKKLKVKADVMLRINPGIEAHTHDFIKTGMTDSKFGISRDEAVKAVKTLQEFENLNFIGLHSHIGSQIFEKQSFSAVIDVLMELASEIKKKLKLDCAEIDLGGGIGVRYTNDDEKPVIGDFVKSMIGRVKENCRRLKLVEPKIILEPGRSIIADAGITLYEAGAVKEIPGIRKYVLVDGGMTDNPRQILYQAKYDALIANKADKKNEETYTIAGKACESGDILIKDISFPKIERGDIIAVLCTGAYNYSMSSNYNRIPRPAVVMVKDGRPSLVVKRETNEDLVRNDL
ncbi:MAG: diaminopimelate decarboxylase [Candidatus Margulisiibacteriota bacterium]